MKIIYKDNVIECLEDLANYDLQKIAWFDNDQGLMYSYDENVDDLFDNTVLNDLFAEGEIVFGKVADDALRELWTVCEAVPDKRIYTKDFIDSDEMSIIREMAKRCLKLIEESDGSESTVMFLKPGEPPPEDA
jgi:hypothetical protein